ncbi:MAG: cytidine deaminase [Candidatus Obscuribacterales bacterium]|nr:cytidine deaminase [Candidatus Obscuribacterales bacterium]
MAQKSLIALSQLSRTEKRLVNAARRAVLNAYCPYSNFAVGAAVLTVGGKIFPGCNVENCSFGAAMCAERVAVFKAVSEGYRPKMIAIYAPDAPKRAISCGCGLCRQVIAEFGLDIVVLKLRNDGLVIRKTLSQLFPNAFVPGILLSKQKVQGVHHGKSKKTRR